MKNFMSGTRGTLTWFLAMALLAALASASLTLAGCEDIAGGIGGKPADITYDVTPDGGAAAPSTKIDFTFNAAVTGLTEDDITLTNDTGAVTKGTLSGGGTSWSLGITVQTAGNVKVSINKEGIESAEKPVTLSRGGTPPTPPTPPTQTQYTITFNGNGGSSPSSQTVNAGGSITLPSSTWSGYTLNGWYTASSGGTKAGNAGNSYTPSASVTLFAQWTTSGGTQPTQYTITFNSQGGSAVEAITANAGGSITLPSSTWSGYTLNGWYTASSGGTKAGNAGNSYTPSASVTLFAQWTTSGGTQPTQYTITFNSQGGSAVEAITANAGTALNKPADPTKTGYTFSGWYSAASGGTKYSWPYTLTGNVTMYAQWMPITYTVVYDANGGTGREMQSSDHTYNVDKQLTSNGFTRTGYDFMGWNTAADGLGTSYANGISVINLTKTNGATVTLYAQWRPITYMVTYYNNGGTGTTVSSSHTYDEPKNLTANGFTINGYTFAGWNTKVDGSGTSYTNGESVINLATNNNATINLCAQWQPITYTVVYDANGGTGGETQSSDHTYNVDKQLTSNGFTRTGYDFMGLNTAADGSGTSYKTYYHYRNLTTSNGATIKLYAQWQPITYKVEYYNVFSGGTGTTDSSSHTYDEPKNLTSNGFTRTGYTFAGWNTEVGGSGTSYSNVQSVINLTTTNGVTVTLYAQWTDNSSGVAVQITLQPQLSDPPLVDTAIFTDEGAQFSAAGSGYTSWKWYWNGVPIDGATSSDYTLAASSKSAGIYELSVVVSTGNGEKLSARSRVTIKAR